MNCPNCYSKEIYYSVSHQDWICTCGSTFHTPIVTTSGINLKLIGVTEDGSHWVQTPSGGTVYLSKQSMKEEERKHIHPELRMPGLDPIWNYYWRALTLKNTKEGQVLKFLQSLSKEQLNSLSIQLKPIDNANAT